MLLMLIIGVKSTPPENGAIIEEVGTLQLVEGVLMAKSDLNIQSYLEANTVASYVHMKAVLDTIKANRQGLSSAQLATLERKVVTNSFVFRQLLTHLDESFTTNKLNASNYDELEETWRNYVYQALHGSDAPKVAEGCVCPFPECEAPCYKDRKAQEEATTEETSAWKRNPCWDEGDCDGMDIVRAFHENEGISRQKRGWFNLGGLGLKVIFGLATEADVKATNESLKQVRMSTHALEIKSHHLAGMVEHALKYIRSAFEKIEGNWNHVEALRNYVLMSQMLDEIMSISRHLLTLAVEAETRISLLKKGLVPPMLTSEQLVSLIMEGRRQFMNLDFPLAEMNHIKKNHTKYMGLLKALPTEDPHIYLICVPFVDQEKKYNVSKLTPFPTRNLEGKIVIPELNAMMAVGKTDFIELDDLSNCEKLDNMHLCDNSVIKSKNFTTCENALMLKDSDKITQLCRYYEIELPKGYYGVSLANQWFIYFVENVYATLTCPGDREGKIIHLEGLLKLEAPCILKTPSYTFGTVQTVLVNMKKKPVVKIPMMEVNITTEKQKSPSTKILAHIDQDLIKVKELKKVTKLQDTDWSVKLPVGASTSSLIIIILCIIAAVILIILIKTNPHRLPWQQTNSQLADLTMGTTVRLHRQDSEIRMLRDELQMKLQRRSNRRQHEAPTIIVTAPPSGMAPEIPPNPIEARRLQIQSEENGDYVPMTMVGSPMSPRKPSRSIAVITQGVETTL